MYYAAELVLRNYVPDSIEPGMFFIHKTPSGENFNPLQIYQFEKLKDIPNMWIPIEEIFNCLGYPVEIYVIDPTDHEILALPTQIGWFDPGDDSDEYRDIELKDINVILANEGLIEIEIDDLDDFYGVCNVILEEEKVIIRIL